MPTHGYGGAPYGGFPYLGGGAPSALASGVIYALEANDRHQVVALIDDARSGGVPIWSYWCPAPAAWGEVITPAGPGDFPPFFACNASGSVPTARWESRILDLGKDGDMEFTVAGVDVDFTIRPDALDAIDGGPGAYGPRFTVTIQGWGVDGTTDTSDFDGLTTAVVESDPIPWSTTAANVSMDPWPTFCTASIPARIEQKVKKVKINVTDAFGIEFLEWRVQGSPVQARR